MENPFEQIDKRLSVIESQMKELITALRENKNISAEITYMNPAEAAKFLNVSKSQIYKMSSARTLPFRKTGKHIFLRTADAIEYIEKGRRHTMDEIEQEATNYILSHPRKY